MLLLSGLRPEMIRGKFLADYHKKVLSETEN